MKKIKLSMILSFFLAFCMIEGVFGQVTLPAIFSNDMVLQRNSNVKIWGKSAPKQRISIHGTWSEHVVETTSDADGRWKTEIPTPEAGGPYKLQIRENTGEEIVFSGVLIGEVWLCSGQSNMEMPLKGYPAQHIEGGQEQIVSAKNPLLRMITVPRKAELEPTDNFEGAWKSTSSETVSNFSATAWYFGNLLTEVLDVPVGLIHVSYGGSNNEAWMDAEMLKDFPAIDLPKQKSDIKEPNRTATALYNGMLSPIIGYGIAGVIWYQGESNYDRPDQYERLLPTMVSSWRAQWSVGEFPFYYAQIAPFNYAQFTPNEVIEKNNSAFIRDAQRKAADKIPNSGMVVLLDVGERDNIHPAKKKEVGHRFAYWALANTYGLKGFEFAGPVYKEFATEGSVVTVSFDQVPTGITSYGKEVLGFEIAGEDRKFHPAQAVLGRKSIKLSSPNVPNPLAVRYAFKDYVAAEIFSTAGLPLSSFRTDDW